MTKHVINPQLSALDHKQYSWRNSPPVKQVSPGSEKERALADDIGTMELCHVALQRLDKKKIWDLSAVLSEVDGLAVA